MFTPSDEFFICYICILNQKLYIYTKTHIYFKD